MERDTANANRDFSLVSEIIMIYATFRSTFVNSPIINMYTCVKRKPIDENSL